MCGRGRNRKWWIAEDEVGGLEKFEALLAPPFGTTVGEPNLYQERKKKHYFQTL
jgi:hypothetical protein